MHWLIFVSDLVDELEQAYIILYIILSFCTMVSFVVYRNHSHQSCSFLQANACPNQPLRSASGTWSTISTSDFSSP